MKIIHKITGALNKFSHYLVSFGPFGLFAIALLDSLAVPMPGGVDGVLLLLAAAQPSMTVLYIAAATIGSTIGSIGLYYISRRAGNRALARFSERKQKRVKNLIDRYDVLSVLVACLMPPPFPLKLFIVSAGVFRLNLLRFTLAIMIGRVFRYSLEGYLAAHYGDQAKDLLARHYPAIGISIALLLIVGFVAKNLLWKGAENAKAVSEVEG